MNDTAKPSADTANKVKPAPSLDGATHDRDLRLQRGKELRKTCPRSSHAEVKFDPGQRDPLALLEESNRGRVEALLPIRFTRMLESPFAFFRGTAVLQAHDLEGTPSAGIIVQCCGDCHLMNFGGFATPERALVFDINDFDETHPGPFEWDVKRLTTSFVLAARWLSFSAGDARRSAEAAVASYRTNMALFAQMSVLETWYAKIAFTDLLEMTNDAAGRMKKRMKEATENTSEHIYEKIVTIVDGQPRIAVRPPLLFRADDHDRHLRDDMLPFFEKYRVTLIKDRQVLFDRYRLVDAAYKVVGIGSVGTRCLIVLFQGNQDDHLFLQMKEARPSVLAGRAAAPPYDNEGERVVTGQRLMQAASDIFLGWTRGPEGRDFYVRQMRDMKFSADLSGCTPRILTSYAELCGKALARAHAKGSGDAATIAGYLGVCSRFDEAIAVAAVAYADQVEKDYELFRAAARAGRFPIETLPSKMEQAIR
jgi:uncharacterized protein (DUF2252 family)